MSEHTVTQEQTSTSTSEEVTSSTIPEQVAASTTGELGIFKEYSSQLDIPEIVGTRIVKCLYQISPKSGERARENSYVRLPTSHLTPELVVEHWDSLEEHILAYLEDVEAEYIKKQHKEGLVSVATEYLSLDKITSYLEQKDLGTRLNKDKIAAWFNAAMLPALTEAFTDKIGATSPDLQVKLSAILAGYRTKFESLAGGRAGINEQEQVAMLAVLDKCAVYEQDSIARRFRARIEAMSAKDADLLEML